ncbi:S9 family peptidase [Paeniglutamicibacter psychrophenolicus]|uniref:Oligopeptidase B n=1 Tax=Paeniglutamicibacter psychrophenolicus TaxID=257454 RepID=A0ABS4WCE2_9MICC|nr:S9 family peptidase [Paeniglutamicibacter psychrophenolicus]MBP2373862.1 oligopeptidase B [Paeniglutamicibacter psychrophenolicus]
MSHAEHALPAPQTPKVPTVRTHHGDAFTDDYEWLRDKDSPAVRAHLQDENAYAEAVTANQEPLREAIFNEIKARTVETDLSVPARKRGWWYFTRTAEGSQYAIHCRVAATDTGDLAADWTPPAIEAGVAIAGEQVLLDGNKEAEGKPFFSLGGMAVSEDGTLLAYAQDNAGDERFTLRLKDLATGALLPDTIENVFYGLVFSPDGTRVFYTVVDESWRPHQIKAHTLGTDPETDVVIFQEDDPGMWLGFDLSADRTELLVSIGNSEYSETLTLDLADERAVPVMLVSREHRILHTADPVTLEGRRAYVITHDRKALNNMVSLLRADQLALPYAQQRWDTVIEHRDTVKVEGTAATATHLVISVRKDTTERIQVLPLAGLGTESQLPAVEPAFDEELYTCSLANAELEAPMIRLSYTSDFTPARVYDYTLADGTLSLRKQTRVNNYDPANYRATREWATAADGTRIPLTILRRADITNESPNPVLVYGYGSYEMSMDPGFGIPRLSLLDRGVVFVIAHVRGGGELGRQWYLDGKKLTKKNTFTDFVDATRHLLETGWADPARIVALGGSAGGLLMGAVANLAPQLYAGIIAQVPFVDALTSILDPDLPLSALEWEEWGNPIEDKDVYDYMKSYSPYENVAALPYPRIAAVTSLNDTRVLYVEPAKWVAKLREETTGSAPIVMKIEMDGGHGGASGRYEGWKTRAWDYAFALDTLGLNPEGA